MASQVTYPVRINAQLDENLSRWLWLVKWLLVIPHYFVLVFLWMAFMLLSIVAFFAILFTGKYPKGIFDFNVGVLRWSWRVAYYSYGALATDRYPPFTLQEVSDYPVHLEVDYPDHLSRGLVLVKWWLLAIPHYLIVGLFMGGAWITVQNGQVEGVGWGLIGLLALIAAVALAFTGRYPTGLFDLILGLNRWVIRVAAYAGLMTDEYPPFRLDVGGNEPTMMGGPPTITGPPPTAGGPIAPPAAPTTGTPGRRGWTAGPILAVVFGSFFALSSFGVLAGGGILMWADATQREGGFLTSPRSVVSTDSYAVMSENLDIDVEGPDWVLPDGIIGDARVRVTGNDALFVGIAPTEDVEAYLSGVAHATASDVGWRDSTDLRATPGGAPSTPPEDLDIWTASSSGSGTQAITWPVSTGSWSVVVMNADASEGVSFAGDVGAEAPVVTGIAIGLLIGGAVLLIAGIALIAGGIAGANRSKPSPAA